MLRVHDLRRDGIEPVSFDLGDGESLAVRGDSGAGKTLLLRALADLDPNEGDVVLNGTARADLSGPRWRRLAGYVPAEPGWWADTVAAHFMDWTGVAALVERLGLPGECGAWRTERLSTGERQRLALVRALERGPRLLLLDEPTSALHSDAAAAVEALIDERRAAGAIVVWVTHDADQAARIARRVLVLEHGRAQEAAA